MVAITVEAAVVELTAPKMQYPRRALAALTVAMEVLVL